MAFDHHALSADFTVQKDGQEMLHYIGRIDNREVPCPDIVLLDLNLPKVKGHAILARLRESPLCGQLPVVIVSSSNAPRDRDSASRLGATHYFCKPNDFDNFMKLGELIKSVVAPHS
jgi:chemotaxis family two-component system response regulator Rcp1